MKIAVQTKNHEQGTILMVALFVTATMFIGIGSYLLLVQTQQRSVFRSQAWNGAMTMAEAGVEEALAQLNPGASDKTLMVDRTANGWGNPAGGFYGPVSRVVNSGNSYSVEYSDAAFPTIYSTGYVTIPNMSSALKRTVCVLTTNFPLFNVSMAARTNIDLNGNGLSANSFNSANTNLSYLGRYTNAPSKTSTNGDVAVLYGSLDLGNHNIYGDVYLGPTATLDKGTNQVSGTIYNDFNYDFPSVVPPDTSGWIVKYPVLDLLGLVVVPQIAPDGKTYTYVFNSSGDYIIPASVSTASVYVGTNAQVRLLLQNTVTDTVKVAGNGVDVGAKLTMYVATANFTIGGGTIDGGRAANLAYYGLPSNKTITFNGNATFTGTIYAPDASITLSGGGNNDYDIVGSVIARSIGINGHFQFHFDEDLLTSGPSRGYTAVHWSEI